MSVLVDLARVSDKKYSLDIFVPLSIRMLALWKGRIVYFEKCLKFNLYFLASITVNGKL